MEKWKEACVMFIGAMLLSIAFNILLIPHQLLSGGLSGISMIIGYFTGWNISLVYLISNLPILIWGLIVIGRTFVVLSVLSVVGTVLLMQVVPVHQLTVEPILSAVFGGVLVGVGIGISLRGGGSTGGFDIVGSILTRKKDFPLGSLLFALNGVVIVALGYFKNDWDLALFSMLSIYISGKVVDSIHVRHIKITALIITDQREALLKRLLVLPRGVSVIKTEGAYSLQQKDLLMTVTTRYELAGLKKIIRETDPKAFVNIVETVGVLGEFKRVY